MLKLFFPQQIIQKSLILDIVRISCVKNCSQIDCGYNNILELFGKPEDQLNSNFIKYTTHSIYYMFIFISFHMTDFTIVPHKINGETYYTHSTWLSGRQRRAWFTIPQQNKNLAIYYTASTLALTAIISRKVAPVSAFFRQFGFYSGSAALGIGSYLGLSILMKATTNSELNSLVQKNDCQYTPFWKTQQSVVNLYQISKKDKVAANLYIRRKMGNASVIDQVKKYNPDIILQNESEAKVV